MKDGERSRKEQDGFGILELMLAVTVTSVGFLALMSVSTNLLSVQTRSMGLVGLQTFSRSLVYLITDQTAWQNYIRPKNASLSVCLPLGGCLGLGAVAKYDINGNLLSGVENPLAIYDSGGALIYDATQAQNGISMQGVPCNSYPSLDCPAQFKVNWYATSPQPEAVVQVSIRLIVKPDLAKRSVNTDRLSFDSAPMQMGQLQTGLAPFIFRSSL